MRADGYTADVGRTRRVPAQVGGGSAAIFTHVAFGHAIVANRRIAGLTIGSLDDRRAIDVSLQDVPDFITTLVQGLGAPSYVSPFLLPDGEPMLRGWAHEAAEILVLRHWDGTVCALDRSGDRLWLTWPAGVRDPEEFLLGTGIGLSLRLHGELCLHATAVVIGQRAVLLAGPSASGKSTIAAVLGADGHSVVADDLSVIRKGPSGFVVERGSCRIRLRPESVAVVAQAIGREVAGTVSPDGAFVDFWLDEIGVKQPSGATDIGAIYFLEPDDVAAEPARLDDMPGADALVALVSDSWAARLQTEGMRRREFESVADMLASVPARRLRYCAGRTSARSVCDAIVRDVLPDEDAS